MREMPRRLLPKLALATPALAQVPWPSRPLRMVIPWPPGQSTDLVGRLMSQALGERLGQNVVPENRPGAGGMIGTDVVAKAAPDGYTLLAGSSGPVTFAPLIQRTPYDPFRDLTPVMCLGITPYVLVVRRDFPAADAREFVALVRANAEKYTFASSGIGGSQHLIAAVFNAHAGLRALHVPFQGSGAAMASLLGGNVDYAIETWAGCGGLVRQGDLRALGQTLPRPTRLLPGMPPLAEASGLPGFGIGGWTGLMAPPALPAPILARLVAETTHSIGQPVFREGLERIGTEVEGLPPEAFAAMLRSQRDLLVPLIRELGIRTE